MRLVLRVHPPPRSASGRRTSSSRPTAPDGRCRIRCSSSAASTRAAPGASTLPGHRPRRRPPRRRGAPRRLAGERVPPRDGDARVRRPHPVAPRQDERLSVHLPQPRRSSPRSSASRGRGSRAASSSTGRSTTGRAPSARSIDRIVRPRRRQRDAVARRDRADVAPARGARADAPAGARRARRSTCTSSNPHAAAAQLPPVDEPGRPRERRVPVGVPARRAGGLRPRQARRVRVPDRTRPLLQGGLHAAASTSRWYKNIPVPTSYMAAGSRLRLPRRLRPRPAGRHAARRRPPRRAGQEAVDLGLRRVRPRLGSPADRRGRPVRRADVRRVRRQPAGLRVARAVRGEDGHAVVPAVQGDRLRAERDGRRRGQPRAWRAALLASARTRPSVRPRATVRLTRRGVLLWVEARGPRPGRSARAGVAAARRRRGQGTCGWRWSRRTETVLVGLRPGARAGAGAAGAGARQSRRRERSRRPTRCTSRASTSSSTRHATRRARGLLRGGACAATPTTCGRTSRSDAALVERGCFADAEPLPAGGAANGHAAQRESARAASRTICWRCVRRARGEAEEAEALFAKAAWDPRWRGAASRRARRARRRPRGPRGCARVPGRSDPRRTRGTPSRTTCARVLRRRAGRTRRRPCRSRRCSRPTRSTPGRSTSACGSLARAATAGGGRARSRVARAHACRGERAPRSRGTLRRVRGARRGGRAARARRGGARPAGRPGARRTTAPRACRTCDRCCTTRPATTRSRRGGAQTRGVTARRGARASRAACFPNSLAAPGRPRIGAGREPGGWNRGLPARPAVVRPPGGGAGAARRGRRRAGSIPPTRPPIAISRSCASTSGRAPAAALRSMRRAGRAAPRGRAAAVRARPAREAMRRRAVAAPAAPARGASRRSSRLATTCRSSSSRCSTPSGSHERALATLLARRLPSVGRRRGQGTGPAPRRARAVGAPGARARRSPTRPFALLERSRTTRTTLGEGRLDGALENETLYWLGAAHAARRADRDGTRTAGARRRAGWRCPRRPCTTTTRTPRRSRTRASRCGGSGARRGRARPVPHARALRHRPPARSRRDRLSLPSRCPSSRCSTTTSATPRGELPVPARARLVGPRLDGPGPRRAPRACSRSIPRTRRRG